MSEIKDPVMFKDIMKEEVDRKQTSFEEKMDEFRRNLDELKQYGGITELENGKTELLLKMFEELYGRIMELEKKIA